MVKRMTIGLGCAILAILLAGFIERQRLRGYWVHEENYGSPGNCDFTQIQQKIRKLVHENNMSRYDKTKKYTKTSL